MPSGGDITEITYNNPNVGTGVLYPKSSEDSNYDVGGIRTDDSMDAIQANGQAIYKKNMKRWAFDVKIGWDMGGSDELGILALLAADTAETDWTMTNINGVVYKGKGTYVGDLVGNGNESTIMFKASGGGMLTII